MPPPESTASRSPIRILEVVDTLDAGGMEKQLVALMNKLGAGEFEFEVCCLRHPGVHASSLDPAHAVHSIGKPEGFRLDVALKLHRLIRRGFDLVHTHNMGPLIYASIATLGGTLCPIFHGEHAQFTPSDAKPGKVFQRQWLYRSCRAIHTVSSQQCDELRAMHIKHPAMFPLINGVNIKNFRPAADASEKAALRSAHGVPWPDGKVLGIVGRFGSFKRHLELIEAFEQIAEAHPDCRLVVVGDGGPNKSQVLEKMRASAFASRMFWSGHQQDVAPFVRMLDLLVVASSNEGLSNVTLEALASGVPVLSNTVCGADELIQHGQGGWVKDLSTVSRLAGALRDCVSLSTSELYSVGVRGRLRAETLFSWDAMAQRYADRFRRLTHRA
ncbi:glycosyltransferase [Prosthecobacter sp.]|uniref:glycosyltransferase n=1 Tax=Prosthecobacter sp. TaxID=1965333 RepID=UPI003785055C